MNHHKTGYEKWQEDRANANTDVKWQAYDEDIKRTVDEFNRNLASTKGYFPLDWRMIKAMAWTETGANSPGWKTRPLQIGNTGDPGLRALLSGIEGGELIIPDDLRPFLTDVVIRTNPKRNIQAGTAYLLMRCASYDFIDALDENDSKTYEYIVKSGDKLDRIARQHSTTLKILREMNQNIEIIKHGQVLHYKKGSKKKIITGWRSFSTGNIARLYNCGGDPMYQKKLDFCLFIINANK